MGTKPMFQHRHYVAIAQVIDAARNADRSQQTRSFQAGRNNALDDIQLAVTALFARDNPTFDSARFAAACAGKPQTRRDTA